MPAELLTHPDVTQAVVRILRCAGIARQDLNDAVADVQLRILHALRNKLRSSWPQTVESWKALAITSTKTFLYDRWKKSRRRKKLGDVGLVVEDTDQHAAEARRRSEREPLDQEKALVLLDAFFAERHKGDLDARILDAMLDDRDQTEIAAELGLTHQQVRDRIRAMRAAFSAKVTAAFGAGALALLLLLRGPAAPHGYYAPGPDVAFTEASPEEEAADLRDLARASCRTAAWDRCAELLDEARTLDPAGDRAPEIQAVRDRLAEELNDELRPRNAKPGATPPPPKSPKK